MVFQLLGNAVKLTPLYPDTKRKFGGISFKCSHAFNRLLL